MATCPRHQGDGACQDTEKPFQQGGRGTVSGPSRHWSAAKCTPFKKLEACLLGSPEPGAGPDAKEHCADVSSTLKKCLFLEDRNRCGWTQIQILTEHKCCPGIRLGALGSWMNSSNLPVSPLVHWSHNLLSDKASRCFLRHLTYSQDVGCTSGESGSLIFNTWHNYFSLHNTIFPRETQNYYIRNVEI